MALTRFASNRLSASRPTLTSRANNAKRFTNIRANSTNLTNPTIPTTYFVFTTSTPTLLEGANTTVTVQGYGLATAAQNGTYYWTIESNAGDFGTASGSFTLTWRGDAYGYSIGSFVLNPTFDGVVEGNETFTIAIRTGSTSGNIISTSSPITINDSVPSDDYFKFVTLLLSGNGTNNANNNVFVDSSSFNYTIARTGNSTQGTFTPYGSNWSNYFDGTGDYLTTANIGSITADFTIEGWFHQETPTNTWYPYLFGSNSPWLGGGGIGLYYSTQSAITDATQIYVTCAGAGFLFCLFSDIKHKWCHIALVRSGNTITGYLNGTSVGTMTAAGTIATTTFLINGVDEGGSYDNHASKGHISNFRIVKGTALYTANFTPPTSPLTAVSGTSLLTCQSNLIKDNSTNAFAITPNGNSSVQRFSPFGISTSYSASTTGGSGYFDGNDYLVGSGLSVNLGTSDFCIEAWGYWTSFNAGTYGSAIISFSDGATGQLMLRANKTSGTSTSVNYYSYINGGTFVPAAGYSSGVGAGTIYLNQWNHIALTRQGSSWRLFVNGALANTQTDATSLSTTHTAVTIGSDSGIGNGYLTGWMSNARMVVGDAVYTAAFTPPTQPVTAISGTRLLCNFTNAGIIDNSMQNNLETVADSKISTAQSKFGGSSMFFDGTGDYLKFASSQNLAMPSDFTIEMWIYPNNWTGSNVGVVSGASNSIQIGSYGNFGTFGIAIQGVDWIISNASLPTTSTWSHLAVTRAGTSVKIFLNGTQSGSTGTSSQSFTPITVIGFVDGGTAAFNGYIDDLRITKGFARYTANFTPPAVTFPTQ